MEAEYTYPDPADVTVGLKALMEDLRDDTEYHDSPPWGFTTGIWQNVKWPSFDQYQYIAIDQRDVRIITEAEWKAGTTIYNDESKYLEIDGIGVAEPWCYVERIINQYGFIQYIAYAGNFYFNRQYANRDQGLFGLIYIDELTQPVHNPRTLEMVDDAVKEVLQERGLLASVTKLDGDPWANIPSGPCYWYDASTNNISWMGFSEAQWNIISLWYSTGYLETYLINEGVEAKTRYAKLRAIFSSNNTRMSVAYYGVPTTQHGETWYNPEFTSVSAARSETRLDPETVTLSR